MMDKENVSGRMSRKNYFYKYEGGYCSSIKKSRREAYIDSRYDFER